ncbi:MAG: glycosyltransferase family 4 protein [Chloroflexia bacterium]
MRVLMLSWEYPPHIIGGLGKHVTELVPALVGEGIEVHVITPRLYGGSFEEGWAGLFVHRVDVPRMHEYDFVSFVSEVNALMTLRAERLIREIGRPDLIHAHDWLVARTAVECKHRYRIPLVATIHATEKGRGRGALSSPQAQAIHGTEWWLTYEAWRVICASHYMAGQVREFFAVPADKVDVIPNGVDPGRFQKLEGEDLSDFRRQYAAPDEALVLNVGRVVEEKGVPVLVEAIPRVLARFEKAKFVIAGTGILLDSLRRRAEELGVSARVYFCGFVPDEVRDRLYKVASVAVFPSLYEPFGIVALEAMAARTPVVVAETGGLAEVVRHAETGITVYPGDPDSLAWGILHTLEHPEWTRQRVENAYREVLERYNWPTIARQTIAVYERVRAEYERSDWART